jgi:hypothetical protein
LPLKRAAPDSHVFQTLVSEPLAGSHLAQLQAALLDAFSLDELAQLLRLELDCDLAAVVAVQGRTLDAITHDLVVWALRKPEVGLQGLLAAA